MIVSVFSANLFAENSKLFAESGQQGHPLLECMIHPLLPETSKSGSGFCGHHNCHPPGDFAGSLAEKVFNDVEGTDYLTMVKFVASLVWNGEFVFNPSHPDSHPDYKLYQQEDPEKTRDILLCALLSLSPASEASESVKASADTCDASSAVFITVTKLASFKDLFFLAAPSPDIQGHHMENLPSEFLYATQHGNLSPTNY